MSSSAQPRAIHSVDRHDSSTILTTTLSHLPRELLATIFARYCDGYTLHQFWLAAVACRSLWNRENENETVQDVCRIILSDCLARRQKQIVKDCERVSDYITRSNDGFIYLERSGGDGMTRFTRQITRMCFSIDYCENIPLNVVWCGKLWFRDPRHEHASGLVEEKVNVALFVDPRQWMYTGDNTWGFFFPQRLSNGAKSDGGTAVEMILQHYNFVPISPHGRIVGITAADRSALQRISHLMNSCDLVGTLPSSYRDHRSKAGSFVCRIISFAQAQRRIERTTPYIIQRFYDEKSKMTPLTAYTTATYDKPPPTENDIASEDFDVEMDKHSLYCNWERIHHGDDRNERKVDASSFLECYREYCQLHGKKSFW